MLRGIDVSSWQGDYDEQTVAAAGIGFVIVKLTESVDYVNPYFAVQFHEARAIGLVTGVYHYARPARNSPEAEADYFLAQLGDTLQPGDLVALDLEENAANVDLVDWALRWLRRVEAALGFKPLLYSYPYYMQANGLNDSAELAEYPLWYAHYDPGYPDPPGQWRGVAIEQDSGDSTVPGIVGPADTDVFLGNQDALRALGKPGAVVDAGPGPYFAETGKWVIEPLLTYWREGGQVPVFGYPVTGMYADAASGLTLQWFERARLEVATDGTITRGLVGLELAQARGLA